MKKKPKSRWILTLLRFGLCAAAIIYLVYNVPWYDHARLGGPDGPRCRVLEKHPDKLIIERDGRPEPIAINEVHHIDLAGQRVPDIELGIPSVVLQANKLWALLAILIFLPPILLQSYRLTVMVGIQGLALSWWNAIKLTFAGNFFNFALPGMTGGDLVKAYYITRYTHQKTEVVTTIFLDRAVGLFGMVLLAAGAIILTWDPDKFGQLLVPLLILLGGLVVGAVVIFSTRVRHALRLPELAERLPLGDQILRIGRATVAMRQHKLRVLTALALTLILQSIVMVSAAVMAWALGMQGSLAYFFIYVAIGFLIGAVPITPPQAFGVMEYFYVLFFTQGGLNTPSQAVALALAVRLIQLVWAVPGILVPLSGAHLPSAAELERLEAEAAAQMQAAAGQDQLAEQSSAGDTATLAPADSAAGSK